MPPWSRARAEVLKPKITPKILKQKPKTPSESAQSDIENEDGENGESEKSIEDSEFGEDEDMCDSDEEFMWKKKK